MKTVAEHCERLVRVVAHLDAWEADPQGQQSGIGLWREEAAFYAFQIARALEDNLTRFHREFYERPGLRALPCPVIEGVWS